MHPCFEFDFERESTLEQFGEHFFGHLNRSLCPTVLLGFESDHFDGDFGGRRRFVDVDELPTFRLRTIREIEVFGNRIVLPSAGVGDRRFAPNASRAIKIEKAPGTVASRVLDDEVPIE